MKVPLIRSPYTRSKGSASRPISHSDWGILRPFSGTLLRNDPQFLVKKIYQVIKKRRTRALKGTGNISKGK